MLHLHEIPYFSICAIDGHRASHVRKGTDHVLELGGGPAVPVLSMTSSGTEKVQVHRTGDGREAVTESGLAQGLGRPRGRTLPPCSRVPSLVPLSRRHRQGVPGSVLHGTTSESAPGLHLLFSSVGSPGAPRPAARFNVDTAGGDLFRSWLAPPVTVTPFGFLVTTACALTPSRL